MYHRNGTVNLFLSHSIFLLDKAEGIFYTPLQQTRSGLIVRAAKPRTRQSAYIWAAYQQSERQARIRARPQVEWCLRHTGSLPRQMGAQDIRRHYPPIVN